MGDSTHGKAISEEAAVRSWRYVILAGGLGALYFRVLCAASPLRDKFLLELGAQAKDIGLIAAIGSLAMACQILGGLLANRLRWRKTLWILMSVTYRLFFIGVLAAPVLFIDSTRLRIWWIIVVMTGHHLLWHLTNPMWFSWMADLLPRDTVSRLWARHQRLATGFRMGFTLPAALLFAYFESHGRAVPGYMLLGGLGVVLGLIDVLLFVLVPEPANERIAKFKLREILTQPFRDRQYRSFIFFRTYWQCAVSLAAPFFAVYVMDYLGIEGWKTMVLFMTGPLGIMVSSRFWGMLCDTYGNRPVLMLTVAFKSMSPLAFLLAPRIPAVAIPMLAVVMFVDGIVNGGLILTNQVVVLRATPRRNRSMYVAVTNFVSIGTVGFVAPLVAGHLITAFRDVGWDVGIYHFTGYHMAFGASVLLRFGAVFVASRFREENSVPVRTMLSHLRASNPLRVVRALYRLQESPQETVRARAARTLGRKRSFLAVRGLIKALEDSSQPVRRAAADALGKIGTAEASEPLARALGDPSSGIHSPAARALGRIGDFQSLQALLENLTKLEPHALGRTVDSLGQIGDSAAVLPLICLFNEVEDRALRRRIAAALSHLSEAESAEEIMAFLTSQTPTGPGQRI